MAIEFPAPTPKRRVQSWLHVEGTLGIKHPLKTLTDDAGRGERNEMTGHHHARVFIGTSGFACGIAIENGDFATSLGKIPTAAEANDTATNDEYIL